MPTTTWERLAPERRERVVEAAMREFGRQGYSAGSLNIIAREAGVAKGSLFQYFEDKLDFFTAVAELAAQRIQAAMAPWVAPIPADRSYYEYLSDGVVAWVQWFGEHPVERGLVAATHLEIDPVVRERVHRPARRVYASAVRGLVEQARTRGDAFHDDADVDAFTSLVSLLLPHLALAPFEPGFDTLLALYGCPPDERERRVRRLVHSLYAGFGPAPSDRARSHR
ncbi:TetR/AcrR family transcriptional regulator [Streptomyces sp. NPDC051940]|uniref:TetR/AcrR family transcriptional regulator n=1 Tax=Streptomyces sp. NPDC051940 TaxID=3155675 RepID=UPI00341343D8